MNVGIAGNTNFGSMTQWTGTIPQEASIASPHGNDQVTIGGQGVEVPAALTTTTAGEDSSAPRRNVSRAVLMGLLAAGALLGATGCASLAGNGPNSAHSLAQNMTGNMAKSGFESISFLDQYATPDGGGLFKNKGADKDAKLLPLDALDQMLDGKPIFYLDKTDGKPQEIRSWAELRGVQELLKDALIKSGVLPGAPQ